MCSILGTLYTGDALTVLKTLPDESVQCCVRNAKGQFMKGERAHPETEFKKGEHWRPCRPYWSKEWLYDQYVTRGRSASDIAGEFGVTENAIFFWLEKHNIPTRSMKAIRDQKHWGLSGEKNGMYGRRGPEVPNWKGGCTPERQAFYTSREWATACVAAWDRDKACCARCGIAHEERSCAVHHIVSFAVRALRADPDNLVLLCIDCHRFVHSKRNTEGEFIKEGGDVK